MPMTKVDWPAPGAANWTAAIDIWKDWVTGLIRLSLTNYTNQSAPDIAAGSLCEIGGSYFYAASNQTPTGTPTTGQLNYIYIEDDGDVKYSTTAPTWNDAMQAWMNGTDRAVAVLYYDSGTGNYWPKWVLHDQDSMPEEIEMPLLPYGAGTGTANLGWLRFNGQGRMRSLILPKEALITELRGWGSSPNSNVFLQLNLYLSPLNGTGTTLMAQCQWNNTSGLQSDTSITSPLIDISTNVYILQGIEVSGLGNGDLYGAIVRYYAPPSPKQR